jgi:predicted O-methyltransferase YrrM
MSNKDKFYVMRDWNLSKGLLNLIEHIGGFGNTKEMNMIEIGSYLGDSTLLFAEHFNTVLAIDPFLDDYDANDDACNYAPFDKVYEEFMSRTKDVPNIHLIKKTSDEAIEAIKDSAKKIDPRNIEGENLRAFDFVYIDGMHTYEQVKKDIANYLPLIKEGGFIAGHDYVPGFQGVMDAVNEQFGSPDIIFHDTSWLKRV